MDTWSLLTLYTNKEFKRIDIKATEAVDLSWLQQRYPKAKLWVSQEAASAGVFWAQINSLPSDDETRIAGLLVMKRLGELSWEPFSYDGMNNVFEFKRRRSSP